MFVRKRRRARHQPIGPVGVEGGSVPGEDGAGTSMFGPGGGASGGTGWVAGGGIGAGGGAGSGGGIGMGRDGGWPGSVSGTIISFSKV
ncbi:MAG: hypothetical protein ABR588_03750 [Sphingomicrobium sp.]|nr:hypothetical protein [Sphingomonadales bacterium]